MASSARVARVLLGISIVGGMVVMAVGFMPTASAGQVAPSIGGYVLMGGDGGVFSFGVPFRGSPANNPSNCAPNLMTRVEGNGSCFSVALTPDGKGYWVLNGDTGVIYRFGDARSFGEPSTKFQGVRDALVPTFAQIVATPTGNGYWIYENNLVSSLAKIDHFGDAGYFGDSTSVATQTGLAITGNPQGLAATPDGKGYWEFHSDGGIFSFGSAHFFGSMGHHFLAQPIVGMAPTADGNGYWLAASDGGVFAFGDAVFRGSMGGKPLRSPIVGIARNPDGPGYWLAASDGGVFAFGGAPFLGSAATHHLARPIFTIASQNSTPG